MKIGRRRIVNTGRFVPRSASMVLFDSIVPRALEPTTRMTMALREYLQMHGVIPLSARGRLVDSTWIHGNQSFETRDDTRIMAR